MSAAGRHPSRTVAAMYDEGAAAYERHWAPELLRHSRDLVARVPASSDPRVVVDVAAGTGALLPHLVRLAGTGGQVVALDHSHGMLRRVTTPVPRVQADAARLPLADASADVVVLAFVLFLLPDAAAGVTEAARVLRPGGHLLAATWGSQLGTGADAIVRGELDAAGAPAFPDVPRSDAGTDSAAAMRALLEPAGLVGVRTEGRPLDARFDAAGATAMRTGCGVLGWRFARLAEADRDTVLQRIEERVGRLSAEELTDRSEVLLTTARRG